MILYALLWKLTIQTDSNPFVTNIVYSCANHLPPFIFGPQQLEDPKLMADLAKRPS